MNRGGEFHLDSQNPVVGFHDEVDLAASRFGAKVVHLRIVCLGEHSDGQSGEVLEQPSEESTISRPHRLRGVATQEPGGATPYKSGCECRVSKIVAR